MKDDGKLAKVKLWTALWIWMMLIALYITPHPFSPASGGIPVGEFRGPIKISGDGDFTPENGVREGNGTADSPYIISNWTIALSDWEYGIYIRGTKRNFVLENISIDEEAPYKTKVLIVIENSFGRAHLKNIYLKGGNVAGIFIKDTAGFTLEEVTIDSSKGPGLVISGSEDFDIYRSRFEGNGEGIRFNTTSFGRVWNNTFIENINGGVYVNPKSHGITFYENNLIGNTSAGFLAVDHGSENSFDAYGRGNYWGDYSERYPRAQQEDGVWDTPYEIGGEGKSRDNYPLSRPVDYVSPAIINLIAPEVVGTGDEAITEVTVMDDIEVDEVLMEFSTIPGLYRKINMFEVEGWKNHWRASFMVPSNSTESVWFHITAIDLAGNPGVSEDVEIMVFDNDPPTASAGEDIDADVWATVTFNGSGSSDNIGIDSYTWHFLYNGSDRYLHGPTPEFVFYIPGIYNVTLTVTDRAGNSDTDVLAVNIRATPDGDSDGIPDVYDSDDDNDGYADPDDAFPKDHTEWNDNDGDGIGDNADVDDDSDLIPDDWEKQYGLDPLNEEDAAEDIDGDGLTNLQEYTNGTNPMVPDSDGDGVTDAEELREGSDPLDPGSIPIVEDNREGQEGKYRGVPFLAAITGAVLAVFSAFIYGHKRSSRTGRNPQTGKEIKIPTKDRAGKFKAGSALSKKVNRADRGGDDTMGQKRSSRTGRNPQTGKEIKIPTKDRAGKFKAGSELSKKVNRADGGVGGSVDAPTQIREGGRTVGAGQIKQPQKESGLSGLTGTERG